MKTTEKILKTAALATAGIPAVLISLTLSKLSQLASEKIDSDEKLQNVIKEESKKLGINERVKGWLQNKYASRMSYMPYPENSTHIMQLGGFGAKRSTVKHELYHLKSNHCQGSPDESVDSLFNYLFIEEPSAVLYGLGLRVK